MRGRGVRITTALLVGLALLPPPALAQTVGSSDTVLVVKAGERPDPAEIAVRVAEVSFELAETVLIGRDDVFADSMASGLLQGAGAPLLLTPPAGPLPDRTTEEIARLGATRAIVLGGEAAITPAVADELAAMGLAVTRRQGPSRLETAVDIAAADAQDADTAILARAFADPAADDPSQAWADALAVGGWSAETGWPILLTETDRLSPSTAAHLQASGITTVQIVGGTAAVSAAVEQSLRDLGLDVERIAGADRFETAVEVAAKRGAPTAADAARVVLAEGAADPEGWVPAFTTAAASGAEMAPVILVDGDRIPEATEGWLTAPPAQASRVGGYAQADLDEGVRLLCVFYVAALCPQLRALLDLPHAAVTADPAPDAGPVEAGATVAIAVEAVRGEVVAVSAEGCTATGELAPAGGTVDLVDPEGPTCALVVTVTYGGPADQPPPAQRFTFTYDVAGAGA